MTKRSTTAEFAAKASSVHGGKYDYTLVEYKTNSAKVKILCKKHGEYFLQSPAKHLTGQGCPICRYETSSQKITKSLNDFIKSAREVHGQSYDYSQTKYGGSHTPLKIVCREHNKEFYQKATNHLSGRGCPECASEKVTTHILSQVLTTEEFVLKAKDVHGDLYDYTSSVYERSAKKVVIWCNRHAGFFKQSANSHLSGIGCSMCATHGYRGSLPGWLYVLFDGTCTKVGITNNEVKKRVSQINSKGKKKFRVVAEFYFENGEHACLLETTLLRELKSLYKQPAEKFDGSTECFYDLDPLELVNQIELRIATNQTPLEQSSQSL